MPCHLPPSAYSRQSSPPFPPPDRWNQWLQAPGCTHSSHARTKRRSGRTCHRWRRRTRYSACHTPCLVRELQPPETLPEREPPHSEGVLSSGQHPDVGRHPAPQKLSTRGHARLRAQGHAILASEAHTEDPSSSAEKYLSSTPS